MSAESVPLVLAGFIFLGIGASLALRAKDFSARAEASRERRGIVRMGSGRSIALIVVTGCLLAIGGIVLAITGFAE